MIPHGQMGRLHEHAALQMHLADSDGTAQGANGIMVMVMVSKRKEIMHCI
jgi:hypothetical protein